MMNREKGRAFEGGIRRIRVSDKNTQAPSGPACSSMPKKQFSYAEFNETAVKEFCQRIVSHQCGDLLRVHRFQKLGEDISPVENAVIALVV